MIKQLHTYFDKLKSISTQSENWEYIEFLGTWQAGQTAEIFEKIVNLLVDTKINMAVSLHIDLREVDLEGFKEDVCEGMNWKLYVNKTSRLKTNKQTFFYNLEAFKTWAKSLDAFDATNPLFSSEKTVIQINGISEKVIANNYGLCPLDETIDFIEETGLPNFQLINENVHILTKDKFSVEPLKLFISQGECSEVTLPFFQLAVKSLAACLTSEIVDKNSVILRGIRKIPLSLYANSSKLNIDILLDLKNTIKWIYEDKTDLKLKLFLDRLTLDIDYNNDFVSELIKLNKNCLDQAKERFSFITFERKDQYQKELRELLKDLKTISDLYSSKARGVLTNLLRDVLAGLLLIGITILSKIDNVSTAIANPIIDLVFRAFSIYFIVSIIYQLVFDIIDVKKAKDEFVYWKKTSREYISDIDFQKYLNETVGGRERFTYIYYGFLAVTYFALSYLAWNFVGYLKLIVATTTKL